MTPLDPVLVAVLLSVVLAGAVGFWVGRLSTPPLQGVPSDHDMQAAMLQAKRDFDVHSKSHHVPYSKPLAEAWIRWRAREILHSKGFRYVSLKLHDKAAEVHGGKTK